MSIRKREATPAETTVEFRCSNWDEDEFILLKRFRDGFMNLQAQFEAQQVPPGLTADDVAAMTAEQYSKLTWRSDVFNAVVVREMLGGPWNLRYAPKKAGGRGKPVPYNPSLVQKIFDPDEVREILAEIKRLAGGPTEEGPKPKDAFGQDVSFRDATDLDSDEDESGSGDQGSVDLLERGDDR